LLDGRTITQGRDQGQKRLRWKREMHCQVVDSRSWRVMQGETMGRQLSLRVEVKAEQSQGLEGKNKQSSQGQDFQEHL
jgi:hypothetical protein